MTIHDRELRSYSRFVLGSCRATRWAVRALLAISLVNVIALNTDAYAQAQPDTDGVVRLNLPAEVEIKTLVDYVSERLGVKILYDEKIANKKINVRAPAGVPVDSLLGMLQSALRIKGLALVDADAPGWKKIVDTSKLPEIAITEDADKALDKHGAGIAVTQAFVLKYVDPTQLDLTLKPFLTQPGANSMVLKDQKILIVTDYASNVLKLAKLIELIDRPRSKLKTKLIRLKNTDATTIAEQVSSMLDARSKGEGTPAGKSVSGSVLPEVRTNQLLVVGEEDLIQEVQEIVKLLDVPLDLTTHVYELKNVAAERLDRLVKNLIPAQEAKRLYQSTIDADGNILIATTTTKIHQRIRELSDRLDIPQDAKNRGRIRFYKLKFIKAVDALETLRSIEESGRAPTGGELQTRADGRMRLYGDLSVTGPNRPQTQPVAPLQDLPRPPAAQAPAATAPVNPTAPGRAETTAPQGDGLEAAFIAGRAQISVDSTSNSLIVVADPVVQQAYAQLIEWIDRRRPQVLIEAKVVVLDTTDDFALGVEFAVGDRTGDNKLFAFTSYGLSKVDPINGALSVVPGVGGHGVLVNPQVADVIIRAFTKHKRAKVVSAPRVLVNDNSTGLLTSVSEIPFTSVNASQTVATTSFAGFAEAGTTITVTPQVSDADQLQLKYRITLNEFQGQSTSPGVPPPRQTSEIESEAAIPDGYTLIVGGLNRTSSSVDTQSLPFLEDIPIVRWAVSNNARSSQQTSLFIFLRPVILKDDKYRDLKYFSERDTEHADIPRDYPLSAPLLIR